MIEGVLDGWKRFFEKREKTTCIQECDDDGMEGRMGRLYVGDCIERKILSRKIFGRLEKSEWTKKKAESIRAYM